MIKFIYILLSIFTIFIFNGCTEKISISGKILKSDSMIYNNIKTKEELINTLGSPSYIDPVENKYYYYSEKTKTVNFFNTELEERKLIVYSFSDGNNIKTINEYNLDNENEIKLIEERTKSNLIKQGFIEKIFGGVGSAVPTTQ